MTPTSMAPPVVIMGRWSPLVIDWRPFAHDHRSAWRVVGA